MRVGGRGHRGHSRPGYSHPARGRFWPVPATFHKTDPPPHLPAGGPNRDRIAVRSRSRFPWNSTTTTLPISLEGGFFFPLGNHIVHIAEILIKIMLLSYVSNIFYTDRPDCRHEVPFPLGLSPGEPLNPMYWGLGGLPVFRFILLLEITVENTSLKCPETKNCNPMFIK